MRRVLLSGWFSFLHGEVTAGDVLALRRVQEVLDQGGVPYDTAWSPGFRPGALCLEDADPDAYTHVVFVCGPLHGPGLEELHRRYAACVRIAVGTSVVAPGDPAATGFHAVLARDAPGIRPSPDLAARAPGTDGAPVTGVILTHGQHEYGDRRRHGHVAEALTGWLRTKDCAPVPLETRLDREDWRQCARPGQLQAVLARLDVVITDRLHGLVLALRAGVPALAVDPVAGGAKVTAQALACDWPAVLGASQLEAGALDRWWAWCLGPGRELAARRSADFAGDGMTDSADQLLAALGAPGIRAGRPAQGT
ncbi:polysaccharide pyruvyl transferase family protein [Streptomyces iconiensis]|uniref:Polysaccharide pyruvyl transferase family protein n=1 Tax=Streptomyces iconiensis TaxID=1384038 RepID=A0ABT6ZVH1_9ACTN|nr:polysaccharide pyruvyl transferase family protein [Streptomyces iconiensis]MDJ1132822.1 polysaccharide pyruvyl transferase family protein [Streptomyces iconiensis]